MPPIARSQRLSGQWIGHTSGEYDARVLMDLDPIEGYARGTAHFFPDDHRFPCAFATFEHVDELAPGSVESSVTYFNPANGYTPSVPELTEAFPEAQLSWRVRIIFEPKNEDEISVNWITERGFSAKGIVRRMSLAPRSLVTPEPEVADWTAFQHYVTEQSMDGFIYRGQSQPWPLQTSFHRTSRKDLGRYLREDVQSLYRALTGRTRHIFDLAKPQENGAFLNLAQHHGFPTPLLDWTRSPYVAAYFAYSGVNSVQEDDPPVRIFAFDKERFTKRITQFPFLELVMPHFSILEALSIENDRAIPQQGVLALTNLHNVEAQIIELEESSDERYLYAFDLPRHQALEALRHLRLMGITQATMFPGVESICREMRDRHF